jgi:4-amino-4-deoxy-L-arabinose transferase-like glycosyltransferase
MNDQPRAPAALHQAVTWLLLLLATGAILLFVWVALNRLAYPFELEWMEGGMVDAVQRILDGQPLYAEPSLAFIAYIYTPLYFYVSAAVAAITGGGFLPLRMVSFVASLGSLAILFLFARRLTGSTALALLAPGLFAATFRAAGAWFDVARVDALFLCLLLASVYTLYCARRWPLLALSALLMGLAFMTKQQALATGAAMGFYCVVALPPRQKWLWPTLYLAVIAGASWWLNGQSDGWYLYYIVELPRQQPFLEAMVSGFWRVDMFAVAIAGVIGLVFLLHVWVTGRRKDWLFFSLFAASMVSMAWISRAKAGGYDNTLLPAYAAVALLLPLGVAPLASFTVRRPLPNVQTSLASIFVLLACVVQFLGLSYNPVRQIPTAADRAAGEALLQTLATVDGEVFMPWHGHLNSRIGKRTWAQQGLLSDVLTGDNVALRDKVRNELSTALREQQFGAVVLDWNWLNLAEEARPFYPIVEPLLTEPGVFIPVTGASTRPTTLLLAAPVGALAQPVDLVDSDGVHKLTYLGHRLQPKLPTDQEPGAKFVLYFDVVEPFEQDYNLWFHAVNRESGAEYMLYDYTTIPGTAAWPDGAIYHAPVALLLEPGEYAVTFGFWTPQTRHRLYVDLTQEIYWIDLGGMSAS